MPTDQCDVVVGYVKESGDKYFKMNFKFDVENLFSTTRASMWGSKVFAEITDIVEDITFIDYYRLYNSTFLIDDMMLMYALNSWNWTYKDEYKLVIEPMYHRCKRGVKNQYHIYDGVIMCEYCRKVLDLKEEDVIKSEIF